MTHLLHEAEVTFHGSRMCGIKARQCNTTVTIENGIHIFSMGNFICSENFIGQFGYELRIRTGSALENFLKNNDMPNHFITRNDMGYRVTDQEFKKFNIRWKSGTLQTIYSQLTGSCRTFIRKSNLS